MIDASAYLARIDYSGPTTPTAETLRDIHHAHLLAVPFENLDIAHGRTILIDEAVIVRKIVENRRGGFCYELNGAFAALLRSLGFRVTLLSARVSRAGGGEGPEFDHLTLRVDIDESWLADVGFGDSFLEPLRMVTGTEQEDPAGRFRLQRLEERLQLEKLSPEGIWKRQYSFAQQPRKLDDFAAMCSYHQTSPESHFTQNSICTRPTHDGRITLSGMKLIVTRDGRREETMLASEKERGRVLQGLFGIRL